MEEMKTKLKAYEVFGVIILFIIDMVVTGYAASYAWNTVISGIFGVTTITFWQVWAISCVRICILGATGKKKSEDQTWSNMILVDIFTTLLFALFIFILNSQGLI